MFVLSFVEALISSAIVVFICEDSMNLGDKMTMVRYNGIIEWLNHL